LQALGPRPTISPTIWIEGKPLRRGDILVLCSDGLYDLVDDDDIARLISQRDPQDACYELIERALDGGGHDNISVGVFRIIEIEPKSADNLAATKPILVVDTDVSASTRQITVPLKV
jgi:protein phosphatase